MGGKKIGSCDSQAVSPSAPQSGDRSSPGSMGKSSVGYAGILKIGLRDVLGGVNGKNSTSPDRIPETASSSLTGNAAPGGSHDADSCSVECPIDEPLNKLNLDCSDSDDAGQLGLLRPNAESTAADTDCNGPSPPRSAVDNADNGLEQEVSSHAAVGKNQWNLSGIGYKAGEGSSRQHAQFKREYDHHRPLGEREFRPPTLILPDPNLESEFASQQQQSDYRPPQSYLPSSLVMSPHDGKLNLLDPNAREFTPSPSPCPSPSIPGVISIVQPPYHVEPPSHISYAPTMELGPVMYSTDFNGGPVMPIFANGGPLFGAIPGSSGPSWDGQRALGIGMQGAELSHRHISQSSGPHAPFSTQHPHLLRPFVSAPVMHHTYVPSGCSPPMGSPTGSVSAFAVPPPLTGREHVSRALLLSGVPTEISDLALRQELEQWGLVRALGLERRNEGLVTAHYFDLRHSKEALRDIQQQHLLQQQRMQQKFQQQMQRRLHNSGSHPQNDLDEQDVFKDDESAALPAAKGLIGGKAVWAQYTVPVGTAAGLDSHNQGTLVVFNLDVDMPLDELRAAFEAHGAVKELRETPAKRQHKFVEFYDVRDAARALAALDGHEIGGKRVKIEFSRPGGQARRARAQAAQAQSQVLAHQPLVPFVANRINATTMQGQTMFLGWGTDPSMGPQSMPATPGPPPQYMWATSFQHVAAVPPIAPLSTLVQQQQWSLSHTQLQSLSYQPIQQAGPPSPGIVPPGMIPIGSNNHNRQQQQFARGNFNEGGLCSPASIFHAGFGRGGGSSTTRPPSDEPPTGRRRRGGNAGIGNPASVLKMDLTCLPNNIGESSGKQEGGSGSSRDSPRSGKTGLTPKTSPRENAQYVFNADQAEMNSESPRTTLMIKNIPNKYSQSMLLALLDQHCLCCNNSIVDPNEPQSGYDFVYLPIDFKNRCNLGYAFVNFTSVQATRKLYNAFHAQQWEAFNSRKICQVTYARVQGRAALEEHFRNSRFACDTDEYLPLVFSPPRTGIVCPPPIVAAGHLAGRSLSGICSPRGEHPSSSRGNRNGEPQPEKVEKIQRNSGSSNSDQDSEAPTGSVAAEATGSAASTAGAGHAVRSRSNVQQQHR